MIFQSINKTDILIRLEKKYTITVPAINVKRIQKHILTVNLSNYFRASNR